MLVRLFRSNQPGVLLGLLLLMPLLFWRHFQGPVPASANAMPLHLLLQGFFGMVSWGYAAILFLTLCILAAQLTGTMNEAELTDRRNHLPALLFPLLLGTLAVPGSLGPALMGMPFVLWAMRRTWSITSGGPALAALCDGGLLLGLASLFYMPYAFLIVVVWASVSVIRPFHWRDYLVPLVGLALVFYIAWGVLHLLGISSWRPLRTVTAAIPITNSPSSVYNSVLAALLVLLSIISLYRFAGQYGRGVVREQNLRSAFLAFAATLGIIIGLVALLNGWFPPVLLAVPLSLLFTFAFLGTRKVWLSEVAALALLGLALWKQFG